MIPTSSGNETLSLDATLQQAAAHHRAGRLQEAEQLYRAILQVQPNHPDVNHNLGVLLGQAGRHPSGLPHLKTALEADPSQGDYWLSYADALLACGQSGDALIVIQTAMQHGLDTLEARSLRDKAEAAERSVRVTDTPEISDKIAAPQVKSASPLEPLPQAERDRLTALFNAGRHAEVESRARLLIERHPGSGFAWKMLSIALHFQGKNSLSAFQKVAELLPDDAEGHCNLGNALRVFGRLDDAVASCRRAVAIKPDFAEAYYNLGNAQLDLGRLDDAVASYRRALKIKPDYAEAHNNLGNALKELGQSDVALASYRRALEIKPDYVEVHYNLGNALQNFGQLNDAAASYRRALEIKSDYAEAHNNLGFVLQNLGQFDSALESYRRALEIKPDYAGAHSNLLFALNYHPNKSSEEIFSAYREYDACFGLPQRVKWRPHGNSRDVNRRLKVGYVSPDFRRHSCRHFLEPLLAHHDKGAVEVYAYAELAREDEVSARYRGYVDHWVPTAGMTDDVLTERIRTDGIDILVDLAGHTAKNRLSVFARKPAPVSLSWLGFGYTTGLSAVDYLLTDTTSAPEGGEGLFSETPWRLETPGYAYRPEEGMGQVSPLPALTRGYVTFGTLTRAVRINPLTIRVWSEILKRVEGARLVIDSHDFQGATMQAALAEKFKAHGVARDRLEIGYHTPPWDVLRSLDIGLDCFPHNSGTTLFETLYMGVPFVTLAGRPSVGRLGGSILEGVGHPSLIARTEEEYVEIAVALASDLARLATLRNGLRDEMKAGTLMDEVGFARKVEAAYREMWTKWSEGKQCGGSGGELSNQTPPLQTEPHGVSLAELPLAGKTAAGKSEKKYSEKSVSLEPLPQAERDRLIVLFNAGRYAEVESLARLACERYPDSGFAWKGLGVSLQAQGKNALTALQKATELLPDDADAHNSLGVALEAHGRLDDAAASCRRALEIKPGLAEAHSNLGNALHGLGRLDEAVASYRRALVFKPDYAEAHCNLAATLKDCGQLDEALASCERALEIKPDYAEAHFNLGVVLQSLGQLDNAMASYRRTLEITPGFAEAHNNLGYSLLTLGNPVDAVVSFRRALEIRPDYAEAHSNLLFALNFHPDKSREEILAVCREYDERFGLPHRGKWPAHSNSRDAGRRLRIGYVSPDFRQHAVAIFAEPILANHDKSQVEIFCYAEVKREDEYTDRFRRLADHWHSTVGLSDDAAAQMILDHRIDILVDLAGHTSGNRLQIFARKPAPIQLTYLGYPGSTGLSAMDYRITDRYADAEGDSGGEADAFYVERLLRLPDSLCCYRPAGNMPETSPLPALTRGYLTFGSFNNFYKIDRRTLVLWAELLRSLPAARLMMLTVPEGETRLRLTRSFAELGVDAQRLEFHGKLPAAEFYRKFLEVDISLDPVSVSGGTTACESLWMGVPVIALVGGRFITRVSYSFLSTAGFADFAATSPKDYIRIAAHLADDLPLLAELRAGLRDHLATTPLTDEVGFTRNLEKLYREIWGKWCRNGQRDGNGEELFDQTTHSQTKVGGAIPAELPKAGKITASKSVKKGKSSLKRKSLPQTECNRLVALFNAGRYKEMESLAHLSIEQYPDSGFAWKGLGVSLQVQGKNALAALQKAAECLPNDADAHNNLGNALRAIGRLDEAAKSYAQALKIKPDFAEAHNNSGNVLRDLGRFEAAAASCRRALAIKPDFAEAHSNLGNAQLALGQLEGAEGALASYTKALKIKPDYAEAHNNLGVALQALGRFDDAVASHAQALKIKPDYAEAHNNLGNALKDLERLDDAVASYAQALAIKPDYAEAHNNLGNALRELGQLNGALASFARALAINPGFAEAHNNRGNVLKDLERLDDAVASYAQALEVKPDYFEAYNNLGNALKDLGRLDDAVASYAQALNIKPDFAEAHSNLGSALKDFGRFDDAVASFRRALKIKPDNADARNNLLFTLNYHPNMSSEEIFAAYREYDEHLGLPQRGKWQPHGNSRETQRRLKVGYVSPDFRRHSCRHFLEPLLAHHDKNAVEVYAYAELLREDAVTARYRGYVDHWVPTVGMSDEHLSERIRADGIDILVDLAGHTKGNRLSVFARKPAPVSLSWLGFGYTTGLSAVDYLLTDTTSAPEGCEELFSETPWRLETPGYAYRPAEGMGAVSPLPALTRGYFTFGTLTRAVRINQHTIRVWSEILKRVEGSRLVIDSRDFQCVAMQDALAEKFATHGIARERLEIGFHSPPWDVLRNLDIGLDCFPHNSGTTLFETLYMGVPFVTLAGRPSVGRLGSSVLEGIGHPSLIARTEEEYVEIAVALASDLMRLASLRDGLRREMETGALMDEAGFACKVEAAYREMWAEWSGGGTSQPQTKSHGMSLAESLTAGKTAAGKLADRGKSSSKSAFFPELLPQAECAQLAGLFSSGQHLEAESRARLACERYPDSGFAWKVLGASLQVQGKNALTALQKATELLPGDAEAHFNLGNALRDFGRLDDAVASYVQALEIKPDYAEAHNNLGNVQKDLGRLDEAVASYTKALEIKPNHARAYNNLGSALQDFGQFDAALASFRRALEIMPDDAEALSNLLFTLNYHPDKSSEEIFAAYREYDERFGLPHRGKWQPHGNSRDIHRRLKIGYVSPDFRRHSCRHFLEPLLSHHDKNIVEVYAYAELLREDEVTARYRGYVDHWVSTVGMSDDALSERIRADGIDILVDLAGHTAKNRLSVFARKPAPVSLSWLGFGYTTGLTAVDYLLTDSASAPEGSEGLFSETPWRLETPGYAYRPAEGMGAVSPLPALTRGYITFGTLTRAVRINQHTIRVWSEILKRVDDSRLVIDSRNFVSAAMQDALLGKFVAHGVARERLEIGYHSPPWDVLRSLDIGLDCFPHNSGTTLFETLYLGIPFVTLAGRPSVGRLGSSILEGVGHPEWIARTEDGYVEIAAALASDLPKLAALRGGLRGEMETSSLMDEAGFARKVEAAYREMFGRWARG